MTTSRRSSPMYVRSTRQEQNDEKSEHDRYQNTIIHDEISLRTSVLNMTLYIASIAKLTHKQHTGTQRERKRKWDLVCQSWENCQILWLSRMIQMPFWIV